MAVLEDFDASQVDPSTGFDAIPAGAYKAIITASEFKPTSSGTGQYLQFTFQVVDGEYKNRNLWSRLNLKNPSAEAVKIARSELSAICRAVGVLKPGDTQALHNRPLIIGVKCEKRKDTGDITNKISSYKGLTDTTAIAGAPASTVPAAAAPPQQPAPTFNAGTPAPWKKTTTN